MPYVFTGYDQGVQLQLQTMIKLYKSYILYRKEAVHLYMRLLKYSVALTTLWQTKGIIKGRKSWEANMLKICKHQLSE